MTTTENKTATLLKIMLQTQHELNKRQHPEWQNQNYPWRTAIWTEAAELVEYLSPSWKWWKKGDVGSIDIGRVQMEVVDIWHFLMSYMLEAFVEERELDSLEEIHLLGTKEWESPLFNSTIKVLSFESTNTDPITFEWIIYTTQNFVSALLDGYDEVDAYIAVFSDLICEVDLNLDSLYKKYIGKAELNKFRWANGYGSTYHKVWNGKEDNVVLTEILETLEADEHLPERVQAELKARYEA